MNINYKVNLACAAICFICYLVCKADGNKTGEKIDLVCCGINLLIFLINLTN